MKIERIRSLLKPVSQQFQDTVSLPYEGGNLRITIALPCAADQAEISAALAESSKQVISEYQEFVKVTANGPEPKFDPMIAPLVDEKIKSSLAKLRLEKEFHILSHAIIAINDEALPELLEDSDGSKVPRSDAMYDLVAGLPSEAISVMTAVYRALFAKAEAVFSTAEVDGALDAVIEVAESKLNALKDLRKEELANLRTKVTDAAEMAAKIPVKADAGTSSEPKFSIDDSTDPPTGVIAHEHVVKNAEQKSVSNPSPTPIPVPGQEPMVSSQEPHSDVEEFPISDLMGDDLDPFAEEIHELPPLPSTQPPQRVPLNTTQEVRRPQPLESAGPIISPKTAEMSKPEIPAPPRQSLNPHYRPAHHIRNFRNRR